MEAVMKRDGGLLASLPRSGSDGFAECICRANPDLRYLREYFSPIVNWRRSERLMETVGDTLYSTTKNLCRRITDDEYDAMLNDTWRRDGFTFTKENYCAFQLDQY